MTRTPNIYLTPRELEQRSAKGSGKATTMHTGHSRDQVVKAAAQDHAMAKLMRYAGYDEDEGPSSRRLL